MTADAFHEDVVRAYGAGMNGHLAKPINPAPALSDAGREDRNRPLTQKKYINQSLILTRKRILLYNYKQDIKGIYAIDSIKKNEKNRLKLTNKQGGETVCQMYRLNIHYKEEDLQMIARAHITIAAGKAYRQRLFRKVEWGDGPH